MTPHPYHGGVPNTRATSAQALQQLGLPALTGQRRQIFDIVVGAQRNGIADLSLQEIRQRFEALHNTRIDLSTISARVNNLCVAGWLVRLPASRACTVTGREVHPVRAPEKQARLCA